MQSTQLHVNGRPIDYTSVPVPYMSGAVERYLENGIEPGSFLAALICNDLREAIARADDNNGRNLTAWVQWFYNNAPSNSWGSRPAYQAWITERQSVAD